MSPKLPIPARIPILYVILGVLVAISVVPMYFYSAKVESINRDRLITNEMLLQNTVTRSLADDLSQHEASLRMMLVNLRRRSGSPVRRYRGDRVETNYALCWKISSPPPMTSRTNPSEHAGQGYFRVASRLTRFCAVNWSAGLRPPVRDVPITGRPWW